MFKKNKKAKHIDPDEIFLDSSNIPSYNRDQFEGRIEKPISLWNITILLGFFVVIVFIFIFRTAQLQIVEGQKYFEISNKNTLKHEIIFANRGIISDRNGKELVWNEYVEGENIPKRKYIQIDGASNLLGHIKYPKKILLVFSIL